MQLATDTSQAHPVHVVVMDDHDNRLRPGWLAEMNAHLDEVEASSGPNAVVVTGAGKFFSNGLDLDHLTAQEPAAANAYFRDLFGLFARLLTFPMRTVAALNGHAFAGGAMLALCFDARVMREDRGWWCIPESDMGVPLHPAMSALLHGRLPIATAHEAIVTGRRYAAGDALAASVVDHAVPESEVLPGAVALAARDAGKDRATQRQLKEGLYPRLLGVLRDPPDLF